MKELLFTIPALPLAGALILITLGKRMSRLFVSVIGVGSVGIAAVTTLMVGYAFIASSSTVYQQNLWMWFNAGSLTTPFALRLDALSLVFIFVITFVGALIHFYSVAFMAEDESYTRFFACMNLFVFSMLMLVLADNLVLLYLGWEGVGLCSYLLIGFWYTEKKNTDAARKAFIVTRVGDTAMAIGLFMLFQVFGTLTIQDILTQAPQIWTTGSQAAVIIGLLLLGGAAGKSAQLPLQTWLPDAMAGPSPVSALIHAATMVTAGVYLIARTHVIFQLAPLAQFAVGVIGAFTLLLAGFSALTQHDLKRVLAYSTISQIGYMFLALGVGAWTAAVFHFMIHAFFKALLFLAAGAIIVMLHHEHNMFRMGGLRKKMPMIFWTFLTGAAALSALPFITGGFYSKDKIVWLSWAGEQGNLGFFIAAVVGALITAMYTFRMVFLTFYGQLKTTPAHHPGRLMTIPLIILAILSIAGGFIELPHTLAHVELLSDFLNTALPATALRNGMAESELIVQAIAGIASLAGVYLAYYFYLKRPETLVSVRRRFRAWHHIWHTGWGFDALYNALIVRPFVYVAGANKNDVIDRGSEWIVDLMNLFNRIFAKTQRGFLRWYVMGIVVGAILILTLSLVL